MSDPSGILLVDKPGGITSHDVVARARRALGTRKVGHAGTLDPMATGLLVLGAGASTRLLTFLVGLDKTYEATIRLGVSTGTDDAEGEVTESVSAERVTDADIRAGIEALTGTIDQVPSTVSAIKVDGRRAYDRVRAGEQVELAARTVTVSRFEVRNTRRGTTDAQGAPLPVIDLDVSVDCSSGTYIRALARDLGTALGVGGHLTALRRTRIGPFPVADAAGIDAITPEGLLSPSAVATAVLGAVPVTAEEARDLRHGKRLLGAADRLASGTAAIDPDGRLVGILERRGNDLKSAMNMAEDS
ncbi:tRNA pseudouridine(55) synthase TruB [Microbacterium schleiferi]|uniref:tRNA pseudouridine synthase B n=1 Tax=Microbacterium schleiferi TaxID=69362 RepID=A0A7S8MZR3_9MICO|nr:tRNA pseudouridine(55) synthase TruB [Microbacterium schleiferi]QPE05370.1 tRNA pseudouridine(55) synthase TruB [Microbacterium schleiferi]